MLTSVLYVMGAYLWGSIPTAYLVARYKKGIDIREYGSGNAGATNAMAYVGKYTGFLIGVFDSMGKGALPVFVANLLDQSLAVQVSMGLAAIAAHNWNIFMRFTGGRGVATALGIILGVWLWKEYLILMFVMGMLGRTIFKETGLWTLASLILLPILAIVFKRPDEILIMNLGIAALLIAKRLTANWEAPAEGYAIYQVMLNRILWDRDVPRKAQWTERRPSA